MLSPMPLGVNMVSKKAKLFRPYLREHLVKNVANLIFIALAIKPHIF